MSIPDYQSLMRPLLDFGSDGSEKNINDAIKSIADQLKLTDEERNQLLPSGKQAIFSNRLHWARTYLDKAGALKRTRRSHFEVTDRGKQLLVDNPTRIDGKVLKQFPEFIAFQAPKATDETENGAAATVTATTTEIPESTVTPEEAVQQAETQIFENLKSQLLIRIWELSPSFFERLVVDLIVAMGYGGSRANVVQRGVHKLPQHHQRRASGWKDGPCHSRQLRRSQASSRSGVAGTPQTVLLSLHAHVLFLA